MNVAILIFFIGIFIVSERNRILSAILILSYAIYFIAIDRLGVVRDYYVLTATLDFLVSMCCVWLYIKTGYVNARYIAYCSFALAAIHAGGWFVNGVGGTKLYEIVSTSLVIFEQILMIKRFPDGKTIIGDSRGLGDFMVHFDGLTNHKRDLLNEAKNYRAAA